jgi:hypothetical protein
MTRRTRIGITVPLALVAILAMFATVGLVAGCGAGDSGVADTGGAGSSEQRAMDEAVTESAPEPVTGSDTGAAEKDAAAGMPDDGSGYAAAVPPASAPSTHYLLRTGDLSLLVKRGTLLPVVDRIKATTAALGGYVMSSNIGSQSGGPIEPMPLDMGVSSPEDEEVVSASDAPPDPYATLVVRVPEQEFETAIKRFSKLGDVQTVSTSSEDVTSQFVDLQARLRHFRAVERRLVGFLQETTTVNQMLMVQDRIDEVQLTIEELTAQLKSMREQTTYGTLSVYVSEKDASAAVHPGNTFGGTFWNSMELLRDGAKVAALMLTALLPFIAVLGAIAMVVWSVVRRLRRSRRQAAQPTVPA